MPVSSRGTSYGANLSRSERDRHVVDAACHSLSRPARLRVAAEPTAAGPAFFSKNACAHGLRAEHVAVSYIPSGRTANLHEHRALLHTVPIAELWSRAALRCRHPSEAPPAVGVARALPRLRRLAEGVHRRRRRYQRLWVSRHIRGATVETLIVFYGLQCTSHSTSPVSSPPAPGSAHADSMEVYAGFYRGVGDRISAVIDARSTRPEADRYYEAGLSVFYTNALASARFADGRGQWLLSARRSNLDLISDMAESNDIGKPAYADGFGRLDYRFSDATSASLHMLLATDRSSLHDSEEIEFANADYRNSYVWGVIDHEWSPPLRSSLLLSYSEVTAHRNARSRRPAADGICPRQSRVPRVGHEDELSGRPGALAGVVPGVRSCSLFRAVPLHERVTFETNIRSRRSGR